jgi:hypothetical protein
MKASPMTQTDICDAVLTCAPAALDVVVVFRFLRHWLCLLLPVHGGNKLRSQAF